MHYALRIPELFVNIFSFLDASDLLSCALVCKLWSEDAQIARWKVCNVTFKALLQRLAPLDGLDEHGLPVSKSIPLYLLQRTYCNTFL